MQFDGLLLLLNCLQPYKVALISDLSNLGDQKCNLRPYNLCGSQFILALEGVVLRQGEPLFDFVPAGYTRANWTFPVTIIMWDIPGV